jgi:hypothetical protein
MTPEKLKLIKQLTALGNITIVKRGVTSLVNAISEMNSKALELTPSGTRLSQVPKKLNSAASPSTFGGR